MHTHHNEKYFLISDIVEHLWLDFEDLKKEFSIYNIELQSDDKVSETTLSYILAGWNDGNYDWIHNIDAHQHSDTSTSRHIWSHQDIYEKAFDIQRWAYKIWISEKALRQELYDHGYISDIYETKTIELSSIKNIIDRYDFDYNNDTVLSGIDAETYKHYTGDQETTYDITWLASIIWVPTSSLVWRLVYNKHFDKTKVLGPVSSSSKLWSSSHAYKTPVASNTSWKNTGYIAATGAAALVWAWAVISQSTKTSTSSQTVVHKNTSWKVDKNIDKTSDIASDEASLKGIYGAPDSWKTVISQAQTWSNFKKLHSWLARGLLWFLSLWLLGGLAMDAWNKKGYTGTTEKGQQVNINEHGSAQQETNKESQNKKTQATITQKNKKSVYIQEEKTLDTNNKMKEKDMQEVSKQNTLDIEKWEDTATWDSIIDIEKWQDWEIWENTVDDNSWKDDMAATERWERTHNAATVLPKTLPSSWAK